MSHWQSRIQVRRQRVETERIRFASVVSRQNVRTTSPSAPFQPSHSPASASGVPSARAMANGSFGWSGSRLHS